VERRDLRMKVNDIETENDGLRKSIEKRQFEEVRVHEDMEEMRQKVCHTIITHYNHALQPRTITTHYNHAPACLEHTTNHSIYIKAFMAHHIIWLITMYQYIFHVLQLTSTVPRGEFEKLYSELTNALEREKRAQDILNEQSDTMKDMERRLNAVNKNSEATDITLAEAFKVH
jgi:hypothetical protein